MAKIKEREKAISLRKKGMSYSLIREELGTPKSTLSNWLKDYPLSEERIEKLQNSEQRIEKFRETMKKKRTGRLLKFYDEQKNIIFPLTKRELYLAGLFLYWGEGSKTQRAVLSISNSDPQVIKFFIGWLTKVLNVPKNKIKVELHLYENMEPEKELNFWSRELKLPLSQFIRPYIKNSSSKRINHKGGFEHGTCNARIGGARLQEKVMMAIKSIREERP